MPPVPTAKWLLYVHVKDVWSRYTELKARVTSVFGSVLKMDSTKKVTKKLAGAAAGTAAWVSNVGNEHGQVLMSVLTSHEGQGLLPMTTGLVRRYEAAGVAPPTLLYMDRDCCSAVGTSRAAAMFSGWSDLVVRLDVWHFMRRVTAGLHTNSHPFYGLFMAKLSAYIFGRCGPAEGGEQEGAGARAGHHGPHRRAADRQAHLQTAGTALSTLHTWRGGDGAADRCDSGGLQGRHGDHGHPLGGPGEDGRHLGHSKAPSSLPRGPPWIAAVHPDRKYYEGRAHTSCLPLRTGVHFPGVLPQPPQPLHTRNER
ncbi:uncharacterized protein [Pseudorasbora parva]|uniref:uncharacterized protein isoform X2 n=1 Tax=Pseudorasbora parva TaxID=51549 RepID=UPI00351E4BA3